MAAEDDTRVYELAQVVLNSTVLKMWQKCVDGEDGGLGGVENVGRSYVRSPNPLDTRYSISVLVPPDIPGDIYVIRHAEHYLCKPNTHTHICIYYSLPQ